MSHRPPQLLIVIMFFSLDGCASFVVVWGYLGGIQELVIVFDRVGKRNDGPARWHSPE